MTHDGLPVLVVDDDAGLRNALDALLTAYGYRAEFCASAEELARLDRPIRAACILLDIRLPEADGIEILGALRRTGETVPVVMMTGHGDIPMAVRAMRAGASDFLEKPFTAAALIASLRAAAAPADAAPDPLAFLTPREREVLREILAGRSNKEAARVLGLSPRTVEVHRARIMQKVGAQNLPDLVRRTLGTGAVAPWPSAAHENLPDT